MRPTSWSGSGTAGVPRSAWGDVSACPSTPGSSCSSRPAMSLSRSPSAGGTRETGAIEIRRVDGAEARERIDGLAAVLEDCVAGGASVSYMAPFSRDDARAAFDGMVAGVEQGRRLLVCAFAGAAIVGTVQVITALPPNQPHRGEIAKLLVRRDARRRGVAQRLMERAGA